MWESGNFSRSQTTTCRPARASSVAAMLPAGPPMMATSSIGSLTADQVSGAEGEASSLVSRAKWN